MSDIRSFTPLWGVWEIESTIGEGSFGKVYKAVREEFGRRYECAIKHISLPQSDAEVKRLLNDQLSDDTSIASDYYRQIVEDINNEIGIMHSLRGNTNIVAYEDHQIIPKPTGIGYDIFIRMELLTELSERVKQSAFTEADAVKMGIDICTALEVCAAKNLIHRDIKSQNIFINPEGHYKLGDFGISRQLEKTTSGLSKKGTFSYMAPEVYKGKDYGANADIYSLGLLLYRLLNGNRLPFLPLAPNPLRYDDNEKALAKRMNGEDMPAPAFANEELAKIILKMCAFDRNERYKTATEAKSDLLHIANAPEKVMPMVAPIGPASLTDDPSIHPSPSIDTEKTESVFGAIPPVVVPAPPNPQPAPPPAPPQQPVYYPPPQPPVYMPPPPPPVKTKEKKKKRRTGLIILLSIVAFAVVAGIIGFVSSLRDDTPGSSLGSSFSYEPVARVVITGPSTVKVGETAKLTMVSYDAKGKMTLSDRPKINGSFDKTYILEWVRGQDTFTVMGSSPGTVIISFTMADDTSGISVTPEIQITVVGQGTNTATTPTTTTTTTTRTTTASYNTLYYDANGGNYAPYSEKDPSKITTSVPTRFGYIFDGWAESSYGSVAYRPNSSIYLTSDKTLYAVWLPAFEINAGESKSITWGSSPGSRICYFKFTPSSSGNYKFYSTGDYETTASLYSSSGTKIADEDYLAKNLSMTQYFTSGTTYYFGVKHLDSAMSDVKFEVALVSAN